MADPLRIVLPVPFNEAIRAATAREVVLPNVYYGELQGAARAQAFRSPACRRSRSCSRRSTT
jgi:hypothetical protein